MRSTRRIQRSFLIISAIFAVILSTARAVAAATEPPVLLIHGFGDTALRMEPLAHYLRAHGREVYTMSLKPNFGQVGIETLAEQVAQFAQQTFAPEQKFDLVGYSMGGLVSRYYLQRLGGLDHVHRFVSVSSPHAGTNLAYLMPNAGGREMRPGSAFLRDLNSDSDVLRRVEFTSLYTPLDVVILPAKSSVVACADCRKVWCPSHGTMVLFGQRAICKALEES